jgi:FixJ family two-component response regulator
MIDDPRHGKMVAVVDDDDAVRDSLRLFLETLDHPVVTFASGRQFLAHDGSAVACLVLDHHMPEMMGLQLAEQVRAGQPTPHFAGDRIAIAIHRSSRSRVRDRQSPRKAAG